jgi:hypothetical protein
MLERMEALHDLRSLCPWSIIPANVLSLKLFIQIHDAQ